jgi:hypothetical protein
MSAAHGDDDRAAHHGVPAVRRARRSSTRRTTLCRCSVMGYRQAIAAATKTSVAGSHERRLPLPPSNPRTGWLEPGDGHRVFYEESGRPYGLPVLELHGGPGG